MGKRIVPSVLYLLVILVQIQLCIKPAVLVNILLILYLLMIGELGNSRLMLFLQLSELFRIFFFCSRFLLNTAFLHRFIIFFIKMHFQIFLGVSDQLGNLIFVLCLHGFCSIQFSPELADPCLFFVFWKRTVSFNTVYFILNSDNLIRTVYSEAVNLCLNFSDIIVDRLTQLQLLFSRKNFTVCHIHHSPLL